MKFHAKCFRGLWFCMAILFFLGASFRIEDAHPVLKGTALFPCMHKEQNGANRQRSLWNGQAEAKVMPVKNGCSLGDYRTDTSAYKNRKQEDLKNGSPILLSWLLAGCLAMVCVCHFTCLFCDTKQPLVALHLIYFIHRSDGKKRICFL